ncbi:hypothetical protein LTR56_001702 [Elasticomyces elasticus]|nr:hypothetical protein LTR56_001702 [Elasticomyces elasticus]KAK4932675.1 hypothetical protein LTR49_001099 [Elasticomyces elasticus]KAK5769696.1 hypothetical protein LTS12_000146 [Elasticomyces elasticus]
MASAIALLCLSTQTSAYGCYSGGITFSDFGTLNDVEGIIKGATDILAYQHSTLQPHERAYGRQDRIEFYVQNRLDTPTGVNTFTLYEGFRAESIACPHGGEQDHGNFFYIIDPNEGPCAGT